MNRTKDVNGYPFIEIKPEIFSDQEMIDRSRSFYQKMNSRRSIREFSSVTFPQEVIDNLILTAGTAPSGANKQPWSFCVISDPELKKQIRSLAEQEERESYAGRMSEQWLRDLAPLGTDAVKEFLEIAPYLVVVFKRVYENGEKCNNYYVNESVGIAVGMLLAAIQNAGLCALTHTPSPMNFLQKALARPDNERPYLLIPVGRYVSPVFVPDISRKSLSQIRPEYH